MPMWLCRAGRYGEFENKFLEDGKVYCTWDNLSESIMQFHTKQDLQQYFVDNNPDVKVKTAMNWASQVWPFAHEMKKGEIVVLPSKIKPVIHFGKIKGDYEFSPNNDNPYYHSALNMYVPLHGGHYALGNGHAQAGSLLLLKPSLPKVFHLTPVLSVFSGRSGRICM